MFSSLVSNDHIPCPVYLWIPVSWFPWKRFWMSYYFAVHFLPYVPVQPWTSTSTYLRKTVLETLCFKNKLVFQETRKSDWPNWRSIHLGQRVSEGSDEHQDHYKGARRQHGGGRDIESSTSKRPETRLLLPREAKNCGPDGLLGSLKYHDWRR